MHKIRSSILFVIKNMFEEGYTVVRVRGVYNNREYRMFDSYSQHICHKRKPGKVYTHNTLEPALSIGIVHKPVGDLIKKLRRKKYGQILKYSDLAHRFVNTSSPI